MVSHVSEGGRAERVDRGDGLLRQRQQELAVLGDEYPAGVALDEPNAEPLLHRRERLPRAWLRGRRARRPPRGKCWYSAIATKARNWAMVGVDFIRSR